MKKPYPQWPYAPLEQQIEGLKSITKTMSIWKFERSMDVLVWAGFMTKSHKYRLIKRFRHIIGMSYEDYRRGRSYEYSRSQSSEGRDT